MVAARREELRGGRFHRTGVIQIILLKTIQIHRESVLVKPVNTPITPLCSKHFRILFR